LNKQSRTADKRWSSSLEVGRGGNSSQYKNQHITKTFHRTSEGRNLLHAVSQRVGQSISATPKRTTTRTTMIDMTIDTVISLKSDV